MAAAPRRPDRCSLPRALRHPGRGAVGGDHRRTTAPREKLRQMASASLRSYRDGPRTLDAQRRIILDYLNSVPLAAIRGYGEVIGLGDGLWAWYGADFHEVNRLLREEADGDPATFKARALAYRRVLGLLLAQRRPSYYLLQPEGRRALDEQADRYLTLLAEAGLIPGPLAREAKAVEAGLRERAAAEVRAPYVERKAANDVRVYLLDLLDVPRLYELDRLDLTVETTYDRRVQEAATRILKRLRDPQEVQALGLVGPRMLGQGDPSRVIYSITLFERAPEGNLVRVQAHNFEGPLSVNYGTKLDLGSTAKLRTLVNYLEIVEELHHRYSGRSPEELRSVRLSPLDRLSRWAVDYLLGNPGGPLRDMLDAALERRYPASPAETFFTGGGLHRFENFDETYDGQELTVLEGFRHSVNLVFVRLMRDIVHYYMFQVPGSTARLLEDVGDPRRAEYLARFADQEGRQFLGRFYRKYREKPRSQILEGLVEDRRVSPQRLAWVFRYVWPRAGLGEFAGFLERWAANMTLTERAVRELYHRAAPGDLSLPEIGFLLGRDPPPRAVAGALPSRAPGRHAPRNHGGEHRSAAGGLRLVVPDQPQGRAGPAHPRNPRDGGVRGDPQGMEAPGLPVRRPGSLVRDGHRELRRPARGAGRARGDPLE